MTEHDLQNLIMAELSPYGCVFRMNVGKVRTDDGRIFSTGLPPGFSDLMFVGHGMTAFIEVKSPHGRISKSQIKFLNQMTALGHPAGVARSVEDALKIIGRDGNGK